ncbi:hypothetical protein HYALB_00011148 [Hymenoscyphus albidus]|uniref:Uncharacterized protein n=1 Tax=Hymenoscyphus albidus TaxID=595503 RepID=A0A9N9LQ35_9HELO|nr:hypothetical protein HYALB_00011148 [Hymenoscyphus albidus]
MAAVNLNNVQFWQPPLESNRATKSKDHTLPATNRSSQSNSAMALSRGHQPKDDRISNRGYTQDLTNSESEAEGDSNDELPSVKDILYPPSSQQTSVRTHTQGTRDKPITLDDDNDRLDLDSDTASNSGSTLLEIRADAVLESNKPADPASHEAWKEIDNNWVNDNQPPLFPLERDDLALTGPRPCSLSPAGLSYSNSQGRSEDPTPCLRPTGVGADDGRNELALFDSSNMGGSMDNPSALGSEVLQAFEEQDKLLSPPPDPRRRSPARLQNHDDSYFQAESISTRTEGLGDASQVEAPREGEREDLVRQPEAEGEVDEQQYEVGGVLGAIEGMYMPREEQQDDLDDVQSKPTRQCLPTYVVDEQLSFTLPELLCCIGVRDSCRVP